MKNTTNNTTKATKKEQLAKAKNEQRLTKTRKQIEKQIENQDNFINAKAIQTIQALKQYGKNSKEFTSISMNLCKILVQSKLKRLYNNQQTSNEVHRIVKNNVTMYMDDDGFKIEKYIEQLNNLYIITINKNGDTVVQCTDKKRAQDIEKAIIKISSIGNDHGHDLPFDAYLKLWEYIENATSHNNIENISDTLLLNPFEIVIEGSQIYKNGHIKPQTLWQYRTTNIIKEVSRYIGQKIDNEKQYNTNEKVYDETESDIENQAMKQYYRTKSKYCDEITNINGKITGIVNNKEVQEKFESLPEKCNFSKMEKIVYFNYYIDDLSVDEISDIYKIAIRTVESYILRVKNKVAKSGIFTDFGLTERVKKGQNATVIYMFLATEKGEKGEYITSFESLGKASTTLKIDKGNISKVLKGERKTVNGYKFTYKK